MPSNIAQIRQLEFEVGDKFISPFYNEYSYELWFHCILSLHIVIKSTLTNIVDVIAMLATAVFIFKTPKIESGIKNH